MAELAVEAAFREVKRMIKAEVGEQVVRELDLWERIAGLLRQKAEEYAAKIAPDDSQVEEIVNMTHQGATFADIDKEVNTLVRSMIEKNRSLLEEGIFILRGLIEHTASEALRERTYERIIKLTSR